MDTIKVLDFGSQTTQLIARRIRDIGVYATILPGDSPAKKVIDSATRGIILSGSPLSVEDKKGLRPDPHLFRTGLPILGICYGFHVMVEYYNGVVRSLPTKEYGRASVQFIVNDKLFTEIPDHFTAWMSHGDSVEKLPDGFFKIAETENHIAVAGDASHRIYGIQFHPEVTHCEYGTQLLKNFACTICHANKEWDMNTYLNKIGTEIQRVVKDRTVLLLISGGVDSTVVAALLLQIIDPDQLFLLHIDTGLMRKFETRDISENLKKLGAKHLAIIDASREFLNALSGITDPERKREIIGDLFISIQEKELKKRNIENAFLAQGTLYTDLIESGKGVGKSASVIKTHHNVRSPLVEKKREKGLIIEPLDKLYKDEVRRLGTALGVSEEIVRRHPFPGPGLAVRIVGEVTKEKCDVLREADFILIEELKKRGLYDLIWQAFCVLLPVKSVGVAGDLRKYGWVVAIRAVNSIDGMTADVFDFPSKDLAEISSRITNSVEEIGRVVYDVSSKPPSTIEWE